MNNYLFGLIGLAAAFSIIVPSEGQSQGRNLAQTLKIVDLTHPYPTFKPLENDPTQADLMQPWLESIPIPTFEKQSVLTVSRWETNQGYFDLGALVIAEHHGTHVDAPSHYVNNAESTEATGLPRDQIKMMHQVEATELVGQVVLIDISKRVQKELAKNGGVPSPDTSVTDFSESSQNVVTVQDIEAIEDQISDGIWLVLNLGWSQFYNSGETDWAKSPYVNDWNHPGISRPAVDKLVEIIERKNVKIAGIATDNFGIASGESSKGDDDKWTNGWREHVRLQQRQIMLLENAANLDDLSTAMTASNGNCVLVVGAIKTIRGTGSPIRLFGMCQ